MADGTYMTLIEHLGELRRRIIWSLLAIAACTVLGLGPLYGVMKDVITGPLNTLDPHTTNVFARYNPVVAMLRPYLTQGSGPQQVSLHNMTVMEVFTVKFKLALLCGVLLSAPFTLHQGWAFVSAGLTKRERRGILRYLPLSVALFAGGVVFAYFLAIPVALLFLLSVDPDVTPVLMYGPYFSFIAITLVAFGVAFQMPLVALVLARLGIVPARTLARNRRYAIVLMFVLAAILTPPDPFSQVLLALPLIGLYELGVLLAKAVERPPKRA